MKKIKTMLKFQKISYNFQDKNLFKVRKSISTSCA